VLCLFRSIQDLSAVSGLLRLEVFVGTVAAAPIVLVVVVVIRLLRPRRLPSELESGVALRWRIIKDFSVSSCNLLGLSFNFPKSDVMVLEFA